MKKRNILTLIAVFLMITITICIFSGCKVSIPENTEMMIRGAEFDYEPLSED